MKLGTMAVGAGVLALGLATWSTTSKAQGPLFDQVEVNLPYSVTIQDKTLQPGDYFIEQVRGEGGNGRILKIYSNSGDKFETSAVTIAAYRLDTADNTKVVLHHFGPDYYFDKIWIQGKNYGYEFPLPNSVKEREKERMQPIALAANYQAVQPQAEVTPPPAPPEQPAPTPAPPEVAQEVPPPTPAPAPAPVMPRTSAGWLTMLLSGGLLSGAGLKLRRKA